MLNETSNEAKLKTGIHVIESINIEVEFKVAKLLEENEHLKAQIQEKVFATAALKNELRKSKGNSVDTKFAKPSIFSKLPLQPLKNQSVVRKSNVFKSEQPKFSKPCSSDMVHNQYLEEAKKKTHEMDRNSKTSVMPSVRLQNTTNDSKQKLDAVVNKENSPSEWKTHALIWRNKEEVETINLDNLYNNLKIYEPELTGSTSTSQNLQNMAFVSSNCTNNTSSTNEADPQAYQVTQFSSLQRDDLKQIDPGDLERKWIYNGMDMRQSSKKENVWLSKESRKTEKEIGRKLSHGTLRIMEVLVLKQLKVITAVTPSDVKTVESKHEFADVKNKGVYNTVEPKTVRKNNFRSPIIEDWNSDDESEVEFIPNVENKTVRPSTEKIKFVKSAREMGNPQQKEYKEKGVIDSGCSRHMTGNKCYLTEYEDYDGGFVSFGDGKGRISRKGKIKTGTLVFDDVYFCKELKYNLFSVSQICDKKNNVLFTDTECLVLSSDFKLLDESQVLLRVLRKDNIYSVDLKSIVPTRGLTCLFAKATIDESNLWHRRLGHINFKNINKLVKGNLVRGLPSKIFENDHSCVACQKGKQHKASCKTKLMNSISKPLHMLHMDLFGPTNVKSLMKKSYCLVVTDDFSRFSWVFFLATKDETSGILKTFIIEIENQLDHKVKVIRSDNETELKNSVMNQFCEMKGIKREFSVARTPQQNGVAERKNRTLIEAARTMLVDSNLPTTFWAEAVNTTCYVLNRVLDIKPHNKTPYELICGRTPLIDFMKPFGCPVTILNTKDHLGKFDGKADEGFFVGYSVISKAMRVFNRRTRIVEETLNIRFLENAPNVTGNGPDWLFDVDSLTISMNYVPVVTGNQTNGIAGTRDNIVTGPQDSEEDVGIKPTEVNECGASDKGEEGEQDTRSEFEKLLQQEKQTNSTNSFNTVGTPVSAAGPSFTNDDPSLPVNATEASNAFEDHLFERFSPFKNAFALLHVQNVFLIDDTGIFGNAYDDEDVGAEADLNNLEITMNKVWTLVNLPNGKRAIGIKWVFRNKKDERGIVVRNKARLVAQGYTQEEGIDYDEVFAPVARIEAIRYKKLYMVYIKLIEPGMRPLFTYLIENGFRRGTIDKTLFIKKDKGDILLVHVYVDDIIFGSTKKSLCDEFEGLMHKRFQMSYIGELTFFLGLQVQQKKDVIFISQDKYVANILKKFDFATVKTSSTPTEPNKELVKDEEADSVDVHLYRSMIGSLMYLTASRPDIMIAVCACAWFQVTPKRFISWKCKKQTTIANSTTEAEYVAAANCRG
ncbi:putative ribonuclease H-like domain-containing protein [Tanacetum coccineum]